ncbi:MAG: DUF2062 domain-containing protein [Alphaproteobacteria bacterium]|jgi:uncharacterized protein (DUF2062 family)|nr:DUF2062 domain-containing protein [Alphaproteobacteria bacterium]
MFGRRKPQGTTDKVRAWLWPRGGFKRVLRYLWRRVARIRATPHGIAAGFAAGAAVSFLPLLGLHFVLGAALALATRASVIAAILGTAVGNPWTFPFIWLGSYKLGHAIGIGKDGVADSSIGQSLKTAADDLLSGHFRDAAIESWPVLAPALVGGAIMAAVVWALLYFTIRPVVDRYQTRRSLNMAAGRARWRRPKPPAKEASGELPG